MLDADYSSFMSKHVESGHATIEETARMLGRSVPLAGPEIYQQNLAQWRELGLQTLGDLLRYYATNDVIAIAAMSTMPLNRC